MTISSWLNFGRPTPPGRGLWQGKNFLASTYYSQRTVFASLWVLFLRQRDANVTVIIFIIIIIVTLVCQPPCRPTYILSSQCVGHQIHCCAVRGNAEWNHWLRITKKFNFIAFGYILDVHWAVLNIMMRLCSVFQFASLKMNSRPLGGSQVIIDQPRKLQPPMCDINYVLDSAQ